MVKPYMDSVDSSGGVDVAVESILVLHVEVWKTLVRVLCALIARMIAGPRVQLQREIV